LVITPNNINIIIDPKKFEIVCHLGCESVYSLDISVDAENRRIEEAAKIAQSADVAILFLGSESGLTKGCSTGESNDSTSITLPGKQRDLVLRVASTGVPVVLILISGTTYENCYIPKYMFSRKAIRP